MDREARIARDRDRPPQPVNGQPLDQVVRRLRFAIEQQIVAVAPDEEIEQAFALGRQQPGPDRQPAGHILGHEAVQEAAHILAGQADERAVGEGGAVGYARLVREQP